MATVLHGFYWFIYRYRNSYKHNLSLDMLQEGFHKSFAELFALIKQQHDDREQAGPESALWNASLLEDEPEKLDALQVHLTQAEAALRKGKVASQRNYNAVHIVVYYEGHNYLSVCL